MGFNFGSNRIALIVLASLVVLFLFYIIMTPGGSTIEISYSDFLARLDRNEIEEVTVYDMQIIQGKLKYANSGGDAFKTRIPYIDDDLLPLLKSKGVEIKGDQKSGSPLLAILTALPYIIVILLFFFMFRQIQGGGNKAFSFGKSRAKRYLESTDKITFADVAGQKEAKYELEEVVDFLKNPGKFSKIGARIPKGVLLVGSPGTGKTLLAKAIAGEAGVAFFHMSGSDFVEMFVGVGASRVRDLFEQGRKNAPCILFIDELDAVGRTRGAGYGGGHDEREQTLNQMLVEMDGFDTKDGVIIIAATNRPDVLDPALLRPGRFDRQVVVDMPDVKEREAILAIHAQKVPVDKNVDFERIAKATPGTSGADLANMVNEAALYAARKNSKKVMMEHFEEARDKIFMGIARKSKVITPEEKLATAYHEAGHALLHYYLKHADPLHKVTIIPRGRAGGATSSLPEKDLNYYAKSWILDRIKINMGGYVAENLIYKETTSGASSDIKMATNMARKMVCEWGMSKLGFISLGTEDEPIFLGKEIATHKDYSDDTAKRIDEEIRAIMDTCLKETDKILKENIGQLKTLAEALVERETLEDADIREMFSFPVKKAAAG
ncbi:MAG: ATP-dependent zinc metalloprotease FtsH [Spirochaetales bacterium]|nr:ATP-dependent zinc metalloprotease FtsH [Spirochaetales bacterium]